MSYVSCQYCMRYHKRNEVCPKKPKRVDKKDYDKIYSSNRWKTLSENLRAENLNMCQVCIRLDNVIVPNVGSQVHHMTYLTDDINKEYDRDNLLVCCEEHHLIIHKNNLNSKDKIQKYFKINLEKEIKF